MLVFTFAQDYSFLQIRQVPCFTQGTCVSALAIHVDGDQIVFHAPYSSEEAPILWLNRRIVFISRTEIMITQHWWLHQIQQGKYQLSSAADGYSIDIQVIGIHLQLSISVPQQSCLVSEGLLGNCNMDVSDDLPGPLNTTTQEDLNGEIADRWRVPINESFFVHSYDLYSEIPLPTGAIYSLRIENTGAVTTPTNFTTGNTTSLQSITVDCRVKIQVGEGVILSMNLGRTVTLFLDGSRLTIYDSLLFYDTDILLNENLWSHIYFIVSSNGSLQLYTFTDSGISSSFTVSISSFPTFLADFYISIGQHIIQPTETSILLPSSFVGEVDDLRLWSRPFHPALIDPGRTVNLFESNDQDSLIGLYRFDEFTTSGLLDTVQGIPLLIPHGPWPHPRTIPSDADINVLIAAPFVREFTNESLEAEAENICSVLYPNQNDSMWEMCLNSSEAFRGFFFLSCLRTVSTSRSPDAAFALMSAVLEYCSTLDGNNASYDALCDMLRNEAIPSWLTDLCISSCIYGTVGSNGNCICQYGFWGDTCSSDCPGGHARPCNNNGKCLQEGTCECLPNWTGDDCSQCNLGWSGQDCSLGIVHVANSGEVNTLSAYFSMYGRVVTFDGASIFLRQGYTYNILSGVQPGYEFKFKLRLSKCVNSHDFTLCYDALSIQYRHHTVTMNVNLNVRFGINVWLNHNLILLDHITQITENFIIARLNILQYRISLSSTIAIIVTVHEVELEVQIIAPRDLCQEEGLSGLLSSCNTPGQLPGASCTPSVNGTTNVNQSISNCTFDGSQSSIDNYTSGYISQEIYSSDYEGHLYLLPIQNAGYYLHFRDSVAVSEEIWNFPTELFTLEIYVLPLSVDGVLLSYGTNQGVFSVLLSNTSLQIAVGTHLYDLDLYVELNVWQQITLVWQQNTLIMEVYLFDQQGALRINAIQFKSAIFYNGGHLAIGQWYTPVPFDVPTLPLDPFKGGLDEIRLWTRRTNPSVVRSSWKFNADLSTSDLASLWKMNSGFGDSVRDIIGGYDFNFVDSHAPSWQISGDTYTSTYISPFFFPIFQTANLSDQAYALCHQIYQEGQLFENCQRLDNLLFSKYHTQCLYDIAFQSSVNAAIQSTIAFADICQNELSLTAWPAQHLCNTFQDRDFPYWIGNECAIPCLFGRQSATNNSICECEEGYWKKDCSSICPGGIISPCSGHGLCEKHTGYCSCNIHWLGIESDVEAYACSECSEGWIGTDCSSTTIFHNLKDSRKQAVAVFSSGAHVTMLDGASFHFDIPGIFSLLSTARCRVSIFVIPCNARPACRELAEVYISSGQQELSVRSHGTSISVWLYFQEAWTEIDVGAQQSTSYGISFEFRHTGFVSITTLDGLSIEVSLYGHMMSAVLYLPDGIETGLDSLLGSWDQDQLNDINKGYPSLGSGADWIPINSTFFQESVYSQEYIDNYFALFYRISVDEVMFQHPLAAAFLSGSFMLRFRNGILSFTDLPLLVLDQLSCHLWLRLHDTTRAQQTVLIWQSRRLAIHIQEAKVAVTINSNTIITTITVSSDVWFHITATWRNYDGRLVLYVYNSDVNETVSFTAFGVSTAQLVHLHGSVSIGQSSNNPGTVLVGDIDQIILRSKHIDGDIGMKMRGVFEDYLPEDIELIIPLQEGVGNETLAKIQNGSYPVGHLNGKAEWLPSDAPLSLSTDHTPIYIPETLATEALQICQMVFFEGPLYNNCRVLESTHRFYYESCLQDIAATGNPEAVNISANMFAILCKETLDIQETKLCGFYNYCDSIKELPWWWWIPLLASIIITIIIFVIISVCCWRKHCTKKPLSGDLMMSMKAIKRGEDTDLGVENDSSSFVFGDDNDAQAEHTFTVGDTHRGVANYSSSFVFGNDNDAQAEDAF